MQTTIYFIRHGEVYNPENKTYGRWRDIPLNKKGFEQMKMLGKKLLTLKEKPAAIYHSPLLRTKQSAETLAKIFLVNPDHLIKDERLLETGTQGFENLPVKAFYDLGDYYLPRDGFTIETP